MGEANEGNKRSLLEKLSLEPNRFPRDLLQRFMATNNNLREQEEAEEGSEEVELSLGLSLGGRFGVNKIVGGLVRSSSIASCLPVVRDDDAVAPPRASYPALIRTSSLPTETEEQWRKRKEMQTLRRMEAKRRRSEKQRNLKSDKEGGGSGSGGGGSERSFDDERAQFEVNLRGRDQNTGASNRIPLGLTSWAPATGGRQGCVSGGSGGPDGKPSGSVESQGGSSSISESAIRPNQGSNSCAEPDAASLRSLQERGSQEAIRSSSSKGKECACNPPPLNPQNPSTLKTQNPSKPMEKQGRRESSLEDMPCVFTMGDGPNGRRVDGILYKYGKGEEVRIMCVCHGRFLSPAEFVKHAGGTDVGNPLKHIVINPNASSLS